MEQICVIGAGVMGSGIAAQIANSGRQVLLLDIVSKDTDRSSVARRALAKMNSGKSPQLSHPKRLEFITVGNLDDDLYKIKDCWLIIEVIVEKLNIKQELYNKILPFLSLDAILASNTSTIPLRRLKETMPTSLSQRFMITHFFNPPRYMPLLELVTDQTTDAKAIELISDFITKGLGKSIVRCNDTPGFIANRIGCFLLELTLRKAIKHKADVETLDLILSEKLTLPSTGIFGLYDLIGLDVMSLIAKSLIAALPPDDRFLEIYTEVPLIQKMIKDGYTGRKGLGGFYRIREENGGKVKEVIDLETGEYSVSLGLDARFSGGSRDPREPKPEENRCIAEILTEFETYVRSLVPEVTNNPDDIDRAMKLGYSWKKGPFELFSSRELPSSHLTRGSHEARKTLGSTPEGNNIFNINTKLNCLSPEVFTRLIKAVESTAEPLYIYSQAPNFSAGADLKFLLQNIQDKDWCAIEDYLKLGQKAMLVVKYAPYPVISCARGVALGGGCELLLHSHSVIAHQQLSAGLVEASLGLIPAFGGTKEMILRSGGNKDSLIKLLGNILRQNKSSSADYFAEDYLTPLHVNMNTDYLLDEATVITTSVANNLLVMTDSDLIKLPHFTLEVEGFKENTKTIAKELTALSGKRMSEEDLLIFEREVFMKLVREAEVENLIKKVVG